jgi:mannosyltransferase OCH1-like enzyme
MDNKQLPTFDASLCSDSSNYLHDLFQECFTKKKVFTFTHALKNALPLWRKSCSLNGYGRLLWSLYYKERQWANALPTATEYVYQVLKQVYESYRLQQPPLGEYRIPPIIHQIWLGSSFPTKYRSWQKTWQKIPGFKYHLWTEEDIYTFPLKNRELYDKATNWGERSDIVRYEILYRYGGLYVDTDFVCLKPQRIQELHQQYDFYGVLQPLDVMMFCLANGVIGAVPEHPILGATMDHIRYTSRVHPTPIWARTGPMPFTRVVCSILGSEKRDVVLPPTYFFPRTLLDERIEQPWPAESIAVHHWQASWTLPEAVVPPRDE